MRIAVTSTISWPYIRRGNRCAFELAAYLASRGHDVTFITMKPGRVPRVREEQGVRIEYHALPEKPLTSLLGGHHFEAFVGRCLGALRRGGYDLVQTTFPVDAFAASLHASLTGTPFVHLQYDCNPLHHPTRFGRAMFRRVVGTAARMVVISDFVNRVLEAEYGFRGEMIPLTVDMEQFPLCRDKDLERPRILFTASLITRRKRVDLLVRAFERLLEYEPSALLQLSGHTNDVTTRAVYGLVGPAARRSMEVLSVGRRADLPALYQEAALSVLPSLNEAFGMVITESLASGTPVAATRSGAIPEILDDPGVGVLFDEDAGPEQVCDALRRGLALARDPETWRRCRRHAARYTWERIGPRWEALYEEVLAGRRARPRRPRPWSPQAPRRRGDGLEHLFVEALDRREATYDAYLETDARRPRAVAVARALREAGVKEGRVLVLSDDTRSLRLLLEAMGYEVTARSVVPSVEAWRDPEGPLLRRDLTAWVQAPRPAGPFRAAVVDEILVSLDRPAALLAGLRRHLEPGGVLVVTAAHAARGTMRARLLAGRNIYPWLAAEAGPRDGVEAAPAVVPVHREYTLPELAGLIEAAGFRPAAGTWVRGRTAVHEVQAWFGFPMRTYLARKAYALAQAAMPGLRSHCMVTARVPEEGVEEAG